MSPPCVGLGTRSVPQQLTKILEPGGKVRQTRQHPSSVRKRRGERRRERRGKGKNGKGREGKGMKGKGRGGEERSTSIHGLGLDAKALLRSHYLLPLGYLALLLQLPEVLVVLVQVLRVRNVVDVLCESPGQRSRVESSACYL
eukprot:384789-Hanusia_phi.AAC.1